MWNHRGTGSQRVGDTSAADLVRECEAFLSGGSAVELAASGEPVPAWAWLNLLAHGSRDQIWGLATGPLGRGLGQAGAWTRGLRYLAREIQVIVDVQRWSLEDLQRQALVPLELEMLEDADWVDTGPGLFVMRVVAALSDDGGAPT